MGTYRPNVTDKEQADIEAAYDDSAIRLQWFDGKQEQLILSPSICTIS